MLSGNGFSKPHHLYIKYTFNTFLSNRDVFTAEWLFCKTNVDVNVIYKILIIAVNQIFILDLVLMTKLKQFQLTIISNIGTLRHLSFFLAKFGENFKTLVISSSIKLIGMNMWLNDLIWHKRRYQDFNILLFILRWEI